VSDPSSPAGRGRSGRAKIRAVLFDLGGTLVEERDFTQWADVGRRLFLDLDLDQLAHAYAEVERRLDAEPPSGTWAVRRAAFWQEVLSRTVERDLEPGTGEKFLALRAAEPRTVRVFSDVRRCLDRLQGQRRRLGVISNSSDEASVRAILDRAEILPYFTTLVSSGTEGVWKPDPELFRRGAERIGVPPAEALYVGNLPSTDARAAARAGLHAVWLNREGTGFGDDPPEITSLLEVPLVVRQLERGA
jgi:FMN phosphatase YigB (HAD superfamily)